MVGSSSLLTPTMRKRSNKRLGFGFVNCALALALVVATLVVTQTSALQYLKGKLAETHSVPLKGEGEVVFVFDDISSQRDCVIKTKSLRSFGAGFFAGFFDFVDLLFGIAAGFGKKV